MGSLATALSAGWTGSPCRQPYRIKPATLATNLLRTGDLVTNAVVRSRFGLALAWVVVVGVIGICLYAQMAGRVAAVSGRATFEIIRERLGPRMAAANLGASFFINLMTVTAEIGGVALALQLATDVGPLLWVPVAAFAIWIVIWRVRFPSWRTSPACWA